MEFDFSVRTVNDWRSWLRDTPRSNWIQSWPYSRALFQRDQQRTQLIGIKKNSELIGFMALHEIKLGFIHVLNLHRAPLWFNPRPSLDDLDEFAHLLNKTFPQRLFRRRRWLPEWPSHPEAEEVLRKNHFDKLPSTYSTLWLGLHKDIEVLRQSLRQKWRNGLNKAERSPIEIRLDNRGKSLPAFLMNYQNYMNFKKFKGPSPAFLNEEVKVALQFKEVLFLEAFLQNEVVAGAMIRIHGKTGSYRVAWNSPQGRSVNAHYFLIWKAIEICKKLELTHFDLGGIKPDEAPGVTHFKRGLSGEEVSFLGLYK